MYLYRAVDSKGNTIDFFLSKSRNHKAAKRFFKKSLQSFHISEPRVVTVDKNPAYPIAGNKVGKPLSWLPPFQTVRALLRHTAYPYVINVYQEDSFQAFCIFWSR